MVTEQPVINRFGQTVLGAGAVLTERHIEVFRSLGIAFIEVESEDGSGPLPVDDIHRTAAAHRLRERMAWEPRHPVEKEVFDLSVEVLAERMTGKRSG